VAQAAAKAAPEREADTAVKAEAGRLAAAGVTAFEARRNAAIATHAPHRYAPYAQADRLAAKAAAAAADRHAKPSLLAAPNGADLISGMRGVARTMG
jgi:hypothetical protein